MTAWNICTYLSQNYFCLSLSEFLLLWGRACTGLQPTVARLLCQHLHLGRGGVGERERVMTRAELWTLTTFPSGPISLRDKNVWQRANAKQREMEGTNDKKTDRQKDRQSRERSSTFISHDPVVAMCLHETQPKQSGIVGESVHSFVTTNSLLSLYYINSDNVSQEVCVCVCVCVSSHFNLIESSLFLFSFYYLSRPP